MVSLQMARCLRFVEDHPGCSGSAVQDGVGMHHLSQASRMLAQLEREGLVSNARGPEARANAWRLTDDGAELLHALPGVLEAVHE